MRSEMRQALLQFGMIVMKGRVLSAEEQIELTHHFGTELHKAGPSLRYLPEYPEIFKVSNQVGSGNLNTGQYWHSDGAYLMDPTSITVMHMISPGIGGDTWVVDTAALYDQLPASMQEALNNFFTVSKETMVAHRLVKVHPVTGRKHLYVNLQGDIVDSSGRQHPLVAEKLAKLLDSAKCMYRHQWKAGDTLIVDNFCCAHRGTMSDPSVERVMHRTSVTGAGAWWV